jgi:hypothetical protein
MIQRFERAIDMSSMTTNAPTINNIPPHKKVKITANAVVKNQRKNSRILPNNPKKINAPVSNTNRSMSSIFRC